LLAGTAVLAGTPFLSAPAKAATGLTAGYGFSEGTGSSTADASGNGITGTLVSGPVWTTGKNGTGLSFNGSSTYVDLGNPAALRFNGSMTVSAWVKENANVADDGQIVADADWSTGWQLKSSPDTGVRTFGVAIAAAVGVKVQRYSKTVRALNVWYHVTGVYNASARTLDIYVNGVLDNGVLQGTVPASFVAADVNANIGRRTGGFYLNGVVDDVRIYSRALTLAEIQADMKSPVTPGGTPGFDFTMSNSGNKSVVRGSSVTNAITATLASGTAQAVSFAISGLPAGATGTFSPTSCSPTCSSTLTIGTQASTPLGTSTVTVTGTGGGLSRLTTFSLTVSTAADTTPPVISAVASSNITSSSARITWTTDEPATSQVEYGTTTAYGSATPVDSTLTTSHTVLLSGLAAQTLYNYRVRSSDAAGNLRVGANLTFTTTAASSGGFVNEVLLTGMNLPVAVKFVPDGDMAVLELGGKIWRVDTATWTVQTSPILNLTNIGTGQQGLMDMVLDPAFATNHYYYVFYTLGSPNRDRCSRFTANATFTSTVAGSEFVIYQDAQDSSTEHHGGALNFGNDGKLYITTGEHFDANAAQSLSSSRGKLLRYNKDGTVPTDNPFYDGTGPNFDAIWALGLRNAFRASYDAPTGRLFIGDVGGNVYSTAQEEVHLGARGANYGWPICEGLSCGSNPTYTSPIYAYPHNGRDASITGGFVYRGTQFPASYVGSYFFADYTQNWIRRITLDASNQVTGVFNFEPPDGTLDGPYGDIVYLCQGPDGALYYVDLGYSDVTGQSGISKIRRIRFTSTNQPPTVVSSAQPTQGSAPLAVTFSSAGTSDPEGAPLTYSWAFGDNTTSTQPNPVHTYAASGQYSARLTVSDGVNSSLGAPITIRVGQPPVPTILSPNDGILFRAGDVISFSGNATDAEDGTLPASAFTWNVDFLHEGHVHPGLPQSGTKSGSFTIPIDGHDFHGNTRYRITLTVIDSDGLQSSDSVLIYPDKVNLTFDTQPSGLTLSLDGTPLATPVVYDTLKGFRHTIGAPNQTNGSTTYTFASWSDGGAQQHVIVVPTVAASYRATYTVTQSTLPGGLVAGYRFNEGSGTTTADLSTNGIRGTLVNGPAWTSGKYGTGLSFGGTSYVDLGDPPALELTGSMTLTAWIKISANPGDDGAIVAKLGAAGWQLKTTPDTGPRTVAIQISSSGSDTIQRYGATVLAANTWYHVAGVFDTAARTLNVYVNGVLDNGPLSGTVPVAQYDAEYPVNIAQRSGFPGLFNFLGTIDEVHIFNRALTAAEIQVDMNTPR
jgi:glucose/arabinose dehydrogenase